MHRQSYAEINLSNLNYNAELIHKISNSPKFFCPMIKANAYGHGDFEIAKALLKTKMSHLGVGLIEEALSLRQKNITAPILVFGMFDSNSCAALIENNITPVISEFDKLEYLREKLPKSQRLKIHLKFNTGMNRLGIDLLQAKQVLKFLEENENFILEGICTHLFNAEDAGDPNGESFRQIHKFFQYSESFKNKAHYSHALTSSAIANLFLRAKHGKQNLPLEISDLGIRPGIALYGGEVSTHEAGQLDLRPVMSLKSKLAKVQTVRKNEVISYGARWQAKSETVVGVVPLGYADGYFRGLTNVGEVLCHGAILPVVGTVCMDYFMVDLTSIANQVKVQIGDEVVLIGKQKDKQILASDLAKKVGTISYEILARISARVPRVYVTG